MFDRKDREIVDLAVDVSFYKFYLLATAAALTKNDKQSLYFQNIKQFDKQARTVIRAIARAGLKDVDIPSPSSFRQPQQIVDYVYSDEFGKEIGNQVFSLGGHRMESIYKFANTLGEIRTSHIIGVDTSSDRKKILELGRRVGLEESLVANWFSRPDEAIDLFKQYIESHLSSDLNTENMQLERKETLFREKDRPEIMHDSISFDVFVCHSSKDKPFIIQNILPEFRSKGVSYWFDSEQIAFGDSVTQKIEDGLKKSKYVMPYLSENLSLSGWTRAEYNSILNSVFSRSNESVVVPLLLDNCSGTNIPMLLKDIRRVAYSNRSDFDEFVFLLKS